MSQLTQVIAASRRRGRIDLLSGLLHYWDLSETAASMNDLQSSLNLSRAGTVNTNSTGAPDGGSCVEMNLGGSTPGYFHQSGVASFSGFNSTFTVNIWSYSVSDPNFGNFAICHRNAGNPTYFQIRTRSDESKDHGTIFNTSGVIDAKVDEYATSSWQMLTLRRDGSAVTLHRNGAQVASATFSGSENTGAAPFSIGTSSWDLGNTLLSHRGRLFGAGIWSIALGTDQITRLYNNGMGLRFSDL